MIVSMEIWSSSSAGSLEWNSLSIFSVSLVNSYSNFPLKTPHTSDSLTYLIKLELSKSLHWDALTSLSFFHQKLLFTSLVHIFILWNRGQHIISCGPNLGHGSSFVNNVLLEDSHACSFQCCLWPLPCCSARVGSHDEGCLTCKAETIATYIFPENDCLS